MQMKFISALEWRVASGGVLIPIEDVAELRRLAVERGEEEEDDALRLYFDSDETVSGDGGLS
jgi:hypothetical protein